MPRYCPCSMDEFRKLLKEGKGWRREVSGRETVFVFDLNNGARIKVYSTIGSGNSLGRRKGQDAIRVCVVDAENDVGLEASQKILRTPGWRRRIQNSVMHKFYKWSNAKRTSGRLLPTTSVPPKTVLLTEAEDVRKFGPYSS